MIIRVLGVITGLFFVTISGSMIYIEQDGLVSQICAILIGILFLAYGILGPKKMGKYLPGTVKKIGG